MRSLYARSCSCAPVGLQALLKRARRDQSRVRETKVGAYIARKGAPLARKLKRVLASQGKRIAARAKTLYAERLAKALTPTQTVWLDDLARISGIRSERLAKDVGPKKDPLAALIAELDAEELGEEIDGTLTPAMLAAFRRAAARGASEIGFVIDDEITKQIDEAAVEYADEHGGELIRDLAGTTEADLRALLARAVEEGISPADLADAIEELGAFSEARAEMIARTELAFAHVQGNLEGWARSGLKLEKRAILGDLHSIEDICDEAADAGWIDLDDAFVDGEGDPPFHPNCCVGDTEVAAVGISAHFKRWYEGEVVELITGRRKLTITPNHPVLTPRGWVAAGSLEVGDQVFQTGLPSLVVRAIDPDDCYMESRFDEVAESFTMPRRVSTTRVPTTAEAFHGDGVADGEVDVVWSDRALADWLQPETLAEHAVHENLCRRHGPWSLLARERALAEALDRPLAATRRFVSFGSSSEPLAAAESSVIGDATFGHGPNGQALALKQLAERGTVTAEALCEIYAGFAGCVESVQVVEVRKSHFAGHVYNLSTRDHWYFANGIVTHNCICDIEARPAEDDDGGGDQTVRDDETTTTAAADAEKMVPMSSLLGAIVAPAPRVKLAALLAKNVDAAAHRAATSDLNLLVKPTEAQARAGNYQKGRVRIAGLPLTIENPAGSRRRPEWPPLSAHYGYVRGTEGADGDHVDVFVRPGTPEDWDGVVFIVDQTDADGTFDEHKCMLGWDDESTAVHAYSANYPSDWSVGVVTPMACDAFREWLRSAGTDRPAAEFQVAAA